MTFLEKSNWVVLVVAVPTLLVYVALVVPQVLGRPMAEVAWVEPMLFAIVGFIVANVLGNVVAAASNPAEADKKDQRDREIDRFGERVGNWLVIAGSIAALVLAMSRRTTSGSPTRSSWGASREPLLSSVTRIAAYHGPFQQW